MQNCISDQNIIGCGILVLSDTDDLKPSTHSYKMNPQSPNSLRLILFGAFCLSLTAAYGQTTTHFIGGDAGDSSITIDQNNGNFSQFTFDTGLATATGSYSGSVNGVTFTYDIKFTAIGATKLLNNRGNYLVSDNGTETGRFTEGLGGYGVSVEILNLTDTGGANDAGLDVVFDGYDGFSMSNSDIGSLMTFTPTNTEATNTGSSLSFDRISGNGKDTVMTAVDDTTTLSAWTAGALAMDIYGGRLEASQDYPELRNLIYSFDTVVVPEPQSFALIAGMLGLTSVMLRRRRL